MNDAQRQANEAKRVLKAGTPPSSPTRIGVVPSPKPQPTIDAKQMHDQIVAEYKAKYGHPPELEHVMQQVWKRLGFSRLPAWQKKQFSR